MFPREVRTPHQKKLVIYRYNGDPSVDEVVPDPSGTLRLHWEGEIVNRNRKRWKVYVVRNDTNLTGSRDPILVHHVFLTDKF
jgi:hypothetical protein